MYRATAALLVLVTPLTQAATPYLPTPQATEELRQHIARQDCPAALKALQAKAPQKNADVLYFAGIMYEEGICLKPNIEKAGSFFQLANEAGHPNATSRLISAYAKNTQDPATAIWWARLEPNLLPPVCHSADRLAEHPDAFVAVLKVWPKGQLAACAYSAGVFHRVLSQVSFPRGAAGQELIGSISMTFTPATGKMEWKRVPAKQMSNVRPKEPDQSVNNAFQDLFVKPMQVISQQALKEYPKPPGIDPSWKMSTTVEFDIR